MNPPPMMATDVIGFDMFSPSAVAAKTGLAIGKISSAM
jgi:hypothetical protein